MFPEPNDGSEKFLKGYIRKCIGEIGLDYAISKIN